MRLMKAYARGMLCYPVGLNPRLRGMLTSAWNAETKCSLTLADPAVTP